MNNHNTLLISRTLLLSFLFALLGLGACQQEGPAEKAGKKLDQATEKTGQQLEGVKQEVVEKTETVKEAAGAQAQATGDYVDDAMITAKIKETLLADDFFKATEINVTTANGVVTLSGVVDSEQIIDKALSVANSQKSVKSVQNQLKLKPVVSSQ